MACPRSPLAPSLSPPRPARPRAAAASLAASLLLCLAVAPASLQAQAPTAGIQPAAAAAAAGGERNVYGAGARVRPAGPVAGDYLAFGGRVIVDQPVGGDATLAGAAVDLLAPVDDDVRAAGGDVSVESRIGGELFVAGGNVSLARGASVGGGARLYGGSVTVDGRIDGALAASGRKITVNGEVGGDTRLVGEQIELGPAARLTGNLRYSAGAELKRAEGAVVSGTITRDAAEDPASRGHREWGPHDRQGGHHAGTMASGPLWAGWVASYLALLASTAVFLWLLPAFSAQAADRVRHSPGTALGLGLAALFAVPLLAVLLFITLLGIPLGLAVLALYPVLLLTGYVLGVLALARLLQARWQPGAGPGYGSRLGFFALALAAVMLLAALPWVGALVLAGVTLGGMGACVLELFRRHRGGPPPAPRGTSAPSHDPSFLSDPQPGAKNA